MMEAALFRDSPHLQQVQAGHPSSSSPRPGQQGLTQAHGRGEFSGAQDLSRRPPSATTRDRLLRDHYRGDPKELAPGDPRMQDTTRLFVETSDGKQMISPPPAHTNHQRPLPAGASTENLTRVSEGHRPQSEPRDKLTQSFKGERAQMTPPALRHSNSPYPVIVQDRSPASPASSAGTGQQRPHSTIGQPPPLINLNKEPSRMPTLKTGSITQGTPINHPSPNPLARHPGSISSGIPRIDHANRHPAQSQSVGEGAGSITHGTAGNFDQTAGGRSSTAAHDTAVSSSHGAHPNLMDQAAAMNRAAQYPDSRVPYTQVSIYPPKSSPMYQNVQAPYHSRGAILMDDFLTAQQMDQRRPEQDKQLSPRSRDASSRDGTQNKPGGEPGQMIPYKTGGVMIGPHGQTHTMSTSSAEAMPNKSHSPMTRHPGRDATPPRASGSAPPTAGQPWPPLVRPPVSAQHSPAVAKQADHNNRQPVIMDPNVAGSYHPQQIRRDRLRADEERALREQTMQKHQQIKEAQVAAEMLRAREQQERREMGQRFSPVTMATHGDPRREHPGIQGQQHQLHHQHPVHPHHLPQHRQQHPPQPRSQQPQQQQLRQQHPQHPHSQQQYPTQPQQSPHTHPQHPPQRPQSHPSQYPPQQAQQHPQQQQPQQPPPHQSQQHGTHSAQYPQQRTSPHPSMYPGTTAQPIQVPDERKLPPGISTGIPMPRRSYESRADGGVQPTPDAIGAQPDTTIPSHPEHQTSRAKYPEPGQPQPGAGADGKEQFTAANLIDAIITRSITKPNDTGGNDKTKTNVLNVLANTEVVDKQKSGEGSQVLSGLSSRSPGPARHQSPVGGRYTIEAESMRREAKKGAQQTTEKNNSKNSSPRQSPAPQGQTYHGSLS